jgi:hypothetical protein
MNADFNHGDSKNQQHTVFTLLHLPGAVPTEIRVASG